MHSCLSFFTSIPRKYKKLGRYIAVSVSRTLSNSIGLLKRHEKKKQKSLHSGTSAEFWLRWVNAPLPPEAKKIVKI